MGFTVRYKGTRKERRAAALRDAKMYISDNQWIVLVNKIRDMRDESGIRSAIRGARFLAMFAGIQGAPVAAIVMYALRPKGHWMKELA